VLLRSGVGQYRVNYTTAYATVPTVTAMGVRVAGGCLNAPPATCGVSWDTWGCTDGDFINNFTTTGGTTNITNNGTGCNGGAGGYGNFTAQIVTAAAGANFTVNVTPGGAWTEGYRVWADFNQNGTFDAGESIGVSAAASAALQSFTCTVPAGTTCGTYRLRIRCEFADIPTAAEGCNNPEGESYGEAEDYTLVVSGAGAGVTPSVTLNSAGTGNSEIYIFNAAGTAVDAPFHFQVIGQ